MKPTELRDVASDLQEAVDLLPATDEARRRAEAVVSRLLETSAAEDLRALQAAPEEPGVRDLDAEPPGPLPDAVRALEAARTYMREELDAVAEWKDAAQLVPYLAGVLAEVLPAAVYASAELPAAAATRAYWDAYLTGDPEPDLDGLDEVLTGHAEPAEPTYLQDLAGELEEALSYALTVDGEPSIDLPEAAERVNEIAGRVGQMDLSRELAENVVLREVLEDLTVAAARISRAAAAWEDGDGVRAHEHLDAVAAAVRAIVERLRQAPDNEFTRRSRLAEVAAARAAAAEQVQRVHTERDEAVAEVRAAAQVAAAHSERDTAIDDTAPREQYERSPQVERARRYARDHVAWTYDQLPPAERELLETSTAQGWLDGWWAAQQDRTSDGQDP